MKRCLIAGLILLTFMLYGQAAFSQRITLEGILDQSVSLSEKGENEELAESLKSGSVALQSEANTRGNDMRDKLEEQSKVLKSFIPLANEGNLKTEVLVKAVRTIKLIIGANHINNLLSVGKEGLLGNSKSLTGSLSLLKAGIPALDVRRQSKLEGLIDTVSQSVGKLDSQDSAAKMAASSVKKTLSKIVDLVKEST